MKNYLNKFNLGTWNVQYLYMVGALKIVEANLERYRVAITAVKEIIWTGDGNLKPKKCYVFYSDG